MRYQLHYDVAVTVVVADDDVVDRCLQNHDDAGVPQPRQSGGPGWQDKFYELDTKEKVLGHLGWNLGVKNRHVSNLEGYADLDDTAADAWVDDVRVVELQEVSG